MNVVSRIAIWFFFAVTMLVVLVAIYGEGMASGLAGYPVPESEYRSELIVATVLYLLSLAPLFWPRAPRGLMVFGVVWMVFGGLLLVAFW